MAVALVAGVACSSSSPGPTHDSGTDARSDRASSDSASDAPPLSADCQRLFNCCVGAAAQTPQFCTSLVGQNICDVWLQSYSMAGIACP